ncbi:MAG TPA: hypothetical protein VGJ60_27290 [Chloroflexota bacterium]
MRSCSNCVGIDVVGLAQMGEKPSISYAASNLTLCAWTWICLSSTGLSATRLISAELPNIRVVVLTASEDDSDLFEAV